MMDTHRVPASASRQTDVMTLHILKENLIHRYRDLMDHRVKIVNKQTTRKSLMTMSSVMRGVAMCQVEQKGVILLGFLENSLWQKGNFYATVTVTQFKIFPLDISEITLYIWYL
jgi:hypothetical protein